MSLTEEGLQNWSDLKKLFLNGFLFKILVALIDTIPLYLLVNLLRKKFNLKQGEEVKL